MSKEHGKGRRAVARSAMVSLVGLGAMATTSITPVAASAAVTLTFTGDYGGASFNLTDNWINAAAKIFAKAHPNVKVVIHNIVTTSESTYYAKLDLLERSPATSPDITWEDSFLVKSDAQAGYLTPLPQLKSFSEWKDLYPTFKSMTEVNGTPYSMMVETDVQQLYYDKATFKKAGLPVPWQPKNFAGILSAAEAIKAKVPSVTPMWIYTGTPLGEASSFRGFEVLVDGTANRLYDYGTKKWESGGPGFNAAFNFLAQLAQKKLEESASYWSNPNAGTVVNTQLMPAQKVGIVADGSWVSTEWLPGGASPCKACFSEWGVADWPTSNGQAPGVTNQSGGWTLAIPAKASQKKLALQFIETAATPALLAQYDSKSGQIPVEPNVASNAIFRAGIKDDPLFQQAVTYAAHTNYRPGFGAYNQISADIAAITGEISLGKLTAAQAEKVYAKDVKAAAGAGNVQYN